MANKAYILNYKDLARKQDGTPYDADRSFALTFDGMIDEDGRDAWVFFPKGVDKEGNRFAEISTQPDSKKVRVQEWLLESNRKGSAKYPPVDLYPFIDDPNYVPPALDPAEIEGLATDDEIPF